MPTMQSWTSILSRGFVLFMARCVMKFMNCCTFLRAPHLTNPIFESPFHVTPLKPIFLLLLKELCKPSNALRIFSQRYRNYWKAACRSVFEKKMNSRFKSSSIENRVLHHFHAIETNLLYLEFCFDDSCSFTVIITREEKRIHEQKSSEIRSLPN